MSTKFPSPEQYGKQLAERRRKASKVPEILSKLDSLAAGMAEQAENLGKLPFEQVFEAVDQARDDLDPSGRFEQVMHSLEAFAESMNTLTDSIERHFADVHESTARIVAKEMPEIPESVDNSADIARLEAFIQSGIGQILSSVNDSQKPITFGIVSMEVTDRDENNDIKDVNVKLH